MQLKYPLLFLLNFKYALSWNFAMMLGSISPAITNQISFHYYTGPGTYVKIPLAQGDQILQQSSFDNTRKTVFFFHGWSEFPSASSGFSTQILADAFMQVNTANFIAVNYENIVQHYYNITTWTPEMMNMGVGYFNSVQNTTLIGTSLGYFFKMFTSKCNCENKLHLIGFSLGAQIISYIAAVYGNGKLKRITALEAAGPIYSLPGYDHADVYNGIFMDTIHTDAGVFGYGLSYGTVDFWPNFGIAVQPACRSNTPYKCSHYTSTYYYAESVRNVYAFKAVQCANQAMWTAYMCGGNNITHMGYGISTATPKGDYYLKTNAESPYGMGDAGLTV